MIHALEVFHKELQKILMANFHTSVAAELLKMLSSIPWLNKATDHEQASVFYHFYVPFILRLRPNSLREGSLSQDHF
jgi:hypothetical protein